MPVQNKIYFASDFHLGAAGSETSREREARLVRWLDFIKADASELFLVGDVFDFWFEYRKVIPRGYTRFLGKLAELTDSGVKLILFKGNHDMWMFDYFKEEFGATIISNELRIERGGKKFFIHHGDGMGPGDNKYKLLKRIFRSPVCQWLFARIHPDFSFGVAGRWSNHSRYVNLNYHNSKSRETEQPWAEQVYQEALRGGAFDYLICGHRHYSADILLPGGSRYINLGEWLHTRSYAVFDGTELRLCYFEPA